MPQSNRLLLREDGPLSTVTRPAATDLTESGQLLEATSDQAPHRRPIQIITPGWGSSGYYSAEVLERAAAERIIPAGTHMYLNHASESERTDRPERDVEKIAAVLVEDATWDGQRLTADAELVGPHAELIESLAPYIGVSISGSATDVSIGEAEGRRGPIIEGLAHVASVDFVTHAGRGGMVLLEGARPSMVNARAASHGVSEATVNDTRDALQNALRDEYGGDRTYVWVRDFDDTTVWFEVEDAENSGTYGQGYTQADTGAVQLSGDWTEVRVRTEYVPIESTSPVPVTDSQTTTTSVPAPRSGDTTTQESQEVPMPQIEEARLRQLEADAGRVTTLESERDQARTENAQLRVREGARARARVLVTEANSELAGPVVDRIVESALVGDLPLTEAGDLDDTAFTRTVETARTSEETYLARLTEASGGDGTVRAFGAPPQSTDVAESAPTSNAWGRPLAASKGA